MDKQIVSYVPAFTVTHGVFCLSTWIMYVPAPGSRLSHLLLTIIRIQLLLAAPSLHDLADLAARLR